ncbi:MAG: hypothetical protein AAGA96_06725 [Verrucomicrobiota bacterium]
MPSENAVPNTLYTETGGLRWGSSFTFGYNVTFPFARLTADECFLNIEVTSFLPLEQLSFSVRLKLNDVLRISKQRGIFGAGVRIEHRGSDIPRCLVFWSFSPKALLKKLSDLGYPVA